MNPQKSLTFVAFLFLVFGLTFGAGSGYLFAKQLSFSRTAVHTTGTLVEYESRKSRRGRTSYYPRISFSPGSGYGDEIEFRSSTSVDRSTYSIGGAVPVVYDPANPTKSYIDTFSGRWLVSLILGIFFVIFGGVGGGILYAGYRRKKNIEWLRSNGQRVKVDFVSVGQDTRYRVNRRSPFVIYAQWHDPVSQKIVMLQSEGLWFDPSAYMAPYQEKKVFLEVLIDPNNPRRNWMDLSFLPKVL